MRAPRRIFLVDGLGALLSAVLLGLVLPRFEGAIGVPAWRLLQLAAAAAGLVLFSLTVALAEPRRWRPWLRGLACANAAYCGVTLACAFLVHDAAPIGAVYFAGEAALILALATFELRTTRHRVGAESQDGDSQ